MQNCVAEWTIEVPSENFSDPFDEVEVQAVILNDEGFEKRVFGFWRGGNKWGLRFSTPDIGKYKYQISFSVKNNKDVVVEEGDLNVSKYTGNNDLYLHGALKRKGSDKYLKHIDDTPFFWLGDTWWMGLSKRLTWPEGFKLLTQDRVEKGFNVIQIVAGLYPDMHPFDERGANEAGFPWTEDYSQINPEYFDAADLKIIWLIESGLMPCIVACWGFYIDLAGKEVIKKHWKYLLARYGAYPVVWCIAGEATMGFYTSKKQKENETDNEFKIRMQEYTNRVRNEWTDITRYVRETDPNERVITVHPTDFGHNMIDDESLMDFEMLQTGHSSYVSMPATVSMMMEAVDRKPKRPVLNSEVCYEGICESSFHDIQRYAFWASILSGACGHTYGANGIWQINTKEKPYGPSPHGATWGNTPWEDSYKFLGSLHVALGKKLMERYAWWDFEPHPEWLEKHSNKANNYIGPFAAGIPNEVRVIFLPAFAGYARGKIQVRNLEKDIKYRAYYYDPTTGDEYDQGIVDPDIDGNWRSGMTSVIHDWVLVLENINNKSDK